MNNGENRYSDFLSLEELDRQAKEYATDIDQELEEYVVAQWLIFELGEQLYTVALDSLDEVAVMTNGAMLPHAPTGILGLINLRGNTILLADLGTFLSGRPVPAPHHEQRILIYKDEGERRTGFLVDRIQSIVSLNDASFEEYSPADEKDKGFIEAVIDVDERGVARVDIRAIVEQLGVKN